MKVRQDAWSHEDDLLLAETVLRHIREGSTQLVAFEEVGDKLNRTSAAVGFRWNAIVRNKYVEAIELAKRQRKELKRSQAMREPKQTTTTETETVQTNQQFDLQSVINYLQDLKKNSFQSLQLQTKTERLQEENEGLKLENERLEKSYHALNEKYSLIQEDYQSLIEIMERARKMVVLQESDDSGTAFKMDKNGNLEKLAK